MSQRKACVKPKRLVEGARRVDPLEVMQVGEALIVKLLRLAGRRRDLVVRATNSSLESDRPLEEGWRNDWKRAASPPRP